MTALTVPEVLRRAEQVIAERGWTRGVFQKSGRVCIARALQVVVEDRSWPERTSLISDAYVALRRAIPGINEAGLTGWNDDPARKKAEVRAALLAAAQAAEAGDD